MCHAGLILARLDLFRVSRRIRARPPAPAQGYRGTDQMIDKNHTNIRTIRA